MTESFKTTPLTNHFGVEVHNVSLSGLIYPDQFHNIRNLFEDHSLLLFRRQNLSEADHLKLAEHFGPIEDRMPELRKPHEKVSVSAVSNEIKGGGVTAEMDMHTLHLKANMLWHIDSTFMPVPALCNILSAKVVTASGGETEVASTRAAWSQMPDHLKDRISGKILKHNYTKSREMISKELAQKAMFNKWPPQRWPAIWVNPSNGLEALYIASHVYEVEGLSKKASEDLIQELTEFCTQPEYVYSHQWEVGDVLIFDERATMHRGRPWPYDKPRTLMSVCCSMRDSDGLTVAREKIA